MMVEKNNRKEDSSMSINSERVKKSQEKTDAIMLRPKLEDGKRIREAAAAAGMSVSGFILSAVYDRIDGNAKEEASPYCVDLGEDIGKKATVSAKRYNATITDYVRIVLKERFKQEIQLVLQQIKAERENKEETYEQVNK